MPEPDKTPPVSPVPSDSPSRPLRFFRVFLKRAVYVPILLALLIGVDAWIVVAINGWEGRAEDLRAETTQLGEVIGTTNAHIEQAEAEILLLDEQQVAAALRADELAVEASAEQALSDAIRDVALDLQECATDRLKVVAGLWAHGRSFVAALDAQANSECAAAQADLKRLIGEIG